MFITVSVIEFYNQLSTSLGLNSKGGKTIIDDTAISAAHSYSRGNPKLIDNVMTYALDLGSQRNKEIIDAETMMLAIDAQSLF